MHNEYGATLFAMGSLGTRAGHSTTPTSEA